MRIGDVDVHAIDAGYECRQRQNDGNGRKPFHYIVQVVADDAGKGIEGTAKDVGVHIGHFESLAGIDDRIVKKLAFFFI